jgi:asparagine synthase (glutamine-hydrolysing)
VKLTGVPVLEIVAALEQRLRSYPEDDLEDKHIHFVLFERGFKWLFEGEDRNRSFFWSSSPFYGREPFRIAMGCPAGFKSNYVLYRHFIEAMNPSLVDVESTTRGPSLRDERHPTVELRRTLRRWSPRSLRRLWRRFSTPPVPAAMLECIREQLDSSLSATSCLSMSNAGAVLRQLDRTQLFMLLTLTSTIEYFANGDSVLEHHGASYF